MLAKCYCSQRETPTRSVSARKSIRIRVMARDDRREPVVRPHSRPGEGVIIETSRRMVPLPNGASTFEITLNMGSAPVPERKYVANTASVTYEGGVVYLLFGQRMVGGSKLRTLVVISMSSLASLILLRGIEPVRPQLEDLRKIPGFDYPITPVGEEPPQNWRPGGEAFRMSGRWAAISKCGYSPISHSRRTAQRAPRG